MGKLYEKMWWSVNQLTLLSHFQCSDMTEHFRRNNMRWFVEHSCLQRIIFCESYHLRTVKSHKSFEKPVYVWRSTLCQNFNKSNKLTMIKNVNFCQRLTTFRDLVRFCRKKYLCVFKRKNLTYKKVNRMFLIFWLRV